MEITPVLYFPMIITQR